MISSKNNTFYVQFINHASILIGYKGISILTDPWYFGGAFNNGWNLIVEQSDQEINNLLDVVSYIWISHEHPDHFSVPFFNKYAEIIHRKKITVLFQETSDKRVIHFFEKKCISCIELKNNKSYSIFDGLDITCIKKGFYDSALYVKTPDISLLNLNDCEYKDQQSLQLIKEICGDKVDILTTQFSYAAWKGGAKNIKWRRDAALEKIAVIENQIMQIKPKYVIPFASFVFFSKKENFYLNDSVNKPEKIFDLLRYKSNIVIMKPFEIFYPSGWSESNSIDSIEYWEMAYKNIKPNADIEKQFNFMDLSKGYKEYINRINKNNDILFMRLLNMVSFGKILPPINIYLTDINISICVNLFSNVLEKNINDKCDLIMSSNSLMYIFNNTFGYDTLTVNACFEEGIIGGFIKASKTLAIENYNNLGKRFSYQILFDIRTIIKFFKMILFVKKKIYY